MKPIKRKPDIETESFRMWKSDKGKEFDDKGDKDNTILYEGNKIVLGGFNIVRNKKKEIIFAWKLKVEDNLFLFYFEPRTKEEESEIGLALTKLKDLAYSFGYQTQDIKETFKNVFSQAHLFDKDLNGGNDNETKN